MPPLCCFSPWKGWQHSEHVLCTRRAGAEYCYVGLLFLMAPTQTHSVNANSALSNVNTLTQGWFIDILSRNALNCPPEAIICKGDYKWITASLFHYHILPDAECPGRCWHCSLQDNSKHKHGLISETWQHRGRHGTPPPGLFLLNLSRRLADFSM